MERQYVSVHALNRYIKAVLDNDMRLQTVYIRGRYLIIVHIHQVICILL